MIDKLQAAFGRIYETFTKITPASWLFDKIARLLVATPEELQQPSDFWRDNEERALPTADEYKLPVVQMHQVASEHFRRHLRKDLSWLTLFYAGIACTLIFVLFAGATKIVAPASESTTTIVAPSN